MNIGLKKFEHKINSIKINILYLYCKYRCLRNMNTNNYDPWIQILRNLNRKSFHVVLIVNTNRFHVVFFVILFCINVTQSISIATTSSIPCSIPFSVNISSLLSISSFTITAYISFLTPHALSTSHHQYCFSGFSHHKSQNENGS